VPVTEAEIVDLLTGIARVHVAIILGLSENHPRSAENIISRIREDARVTEPDGTPTLSGLAARLVLEMLEVKPANAEQPQVKKPRRAPLRSLLRRAPARSAP
jgi:hypothetical protein